MGAYRRYPAGVITGSKNDNVMLYTDMTRRRRIDWVLEDDGGDPGSDLLTLFTDQYGAYPAFWVNDGHTQVWAYTRSNAMWTVLTPDLDYYSKSEADTRFARWNGSELVQGENEIQVGMNTKDVGFDVIVLAGQSNMSGVNGSPDALLDPSDSRIYRWVASGNGTSALTNYKSKISLATNPLGHPTTTDGVGPGLIFAQWYLSIIPANRKVLLVPVAVESSPLVPADAFTWNPSVSNSLFASAKTNVNAAVAGAGANARVAAILWIQGEADAGNGTTAAAYQEVLDALISAFRTQLTTANDSTPFVIGSMVPAWRDAPNGTSVQIDGVHKNTPYRVPYTAYVQGPQGSGLHYTQGEARILGRAMLDALLEAQGNTLEPSVPGQLTGLSAAPGASSAVLSWTTKTAFPTVTDYSVQYKLRTDSTWSTFAHTASAATGITVTGLTNGVLYDFRVAAVNSVGIGTYSAVISATPSNAVSIFSHDTLPASGSNSNVGGSITYGLAITAGSAGSVTAVWVPVSSATIGAAMSVGVFPGISDSTPAAQKAFTARGTAGWQKVTLDSPVAITNGQTFVAVIYNSNGDYFASPNPAFPITAGVLTVAGANNSRYVVASGLARPDTAIGSNLLYVDVEFGATA